MTKPKRNATQHQRALTETIAMLTAYQTDQTTVINRLRDWATGLTTTHSGPTSKGTIADPTGNTALSVDEWGQARTRLEALITTAHTTATALEAIRKQIMATDTTDPDDPDNQTGALQVCANSHGCPDDNWASKAGRCEACYQYRHRNNRDRRISGHPNKHRTVIDAETSS